MPITRRAALGATAGLCITAFASGDDKPPAETEAGLRTPASVDEIYRRLRPLFEEERKQFSESSKTRTCWTGPHGKAIIALGPAIIPQLIQELRKGDFFFNVPLEILTHLDIANGQSLSEQEKSKLWLKWWDGGKERS